MMQLPWLSLLIVVPIAWAALVLLLGSDERPAWTRSIALVGALFSLGLCVPVWLSFDASSAAFQLVERLPWFPRYQIEYYLGIDGFSLPLILLSALFLPLVLLASTSIQKRLPEYCAAFLALQGLLVGVFSALDSVLFYLFWEAQLIPMFLIIGIWGGQNRIYATLKFFLYTFLGSIFLLLALLYLHFVAKEQGHMHTFAIETFSQLTMSPSVQLVLFIGMLVAFAVKVPMWPVHTWLPDAHVQAPTGGSVILAAILLKLGGYGIIRFLLPICSDAAQVMALPVAVLSLIAVVYIGLVAIVQTDMKKLIAYSSIAHMGFVTLGFFIAFLLTSAPKDGTIALLGFQGAYIQMISHGFISGAMFLCVGVLYDRLHTRDIDAYGGVMRQMPIFGALFVFFAMSNAGLPGTSGFVGEFMVILSAFQANVWVGTLSALTLILGAAYTLWMIKRVLYGEVVNPKVAALREATLQERVLLGFLAAFVLLFGLWPKPLLDITSVSSQSLLTQLAAVSV